MNGCGRICKVSLVQLDKPQCDHRCHGVCTSIMQILLQSGGCCYINTPPLSNGFEGDSPVHLSVFRATEGCHMNAHLIATTFQ